MIGLKHQTKITILINLRLQSPFSPVCINPLCEKVIITTWHTTRQNFTYYGKWFLESVQLFWRFSNLWIPKDFGILKEVVTGKSWLCFISHREIQRALFFGKSWEDIKHNKTTKVGRNTERQTNFSLAKGQLGSLVIRSISINNLFYLGCPWVSLCFGLLSQRFAR